MLTNKRILITGSVSGIGRAIARRCVASGARVMIHGKDQQEEAEALVKELGKSSSYCLADLASQEGIDLLVTRMHETFGGMDILVNNAAHQEGTRWDCATGEQFDLMFAVNTKAPMLLSQQFIRHVREQKTAGSILNIGSICAHCGLNHLMVYSMTKGALSTFTRNLADQVAPLGIRVNQLNPGLTWTERVQKDTSKAAISPLFWPRGKLTTPEEVAEHALFWLSDASSPATGVIYEVEQYPVLGRLLSDRAEEKRRSFVRRVASKVKRSLCG